MIVGGLPAGINIWETSIIPRLLYHSESWQEISKAAIQQLEDVQLKFLRDLLACGSGCPSYALYWDTGMSQMKFRIFKKQTAISSPP